MFKPGDIVVCINIDRVSNIDEKTNLLKKYSTYIVDDTYLLWIKIKIPSTNIYNTYRMDRFISIKDYRKIKIKTLKYV